MEQRKAPCTYAPFNLYTFNSIINMIQQLFKLMWNSKRNHSLLIIEIFFSFLVLFAVLSFIFYQHTNYSRPMGFESDNVWVVWFESTRADANQLGQQKTEILNRVKAFEAVESVTVSSSAIPFSMTRNGFNLQKEGQEAINVRLIVGDENYEDVMEMPLVEGAWFGTDANDLKYTPIIINKALRATLFEQEPGVGQMLNNHEKRPYKVVGVIDNFRWRGDFQDLEETVILPAYKDQIETLLVKVKAASNRDRTFNR